MRAKWSQPYAAAKYSSTSGCHRSLGLYVYRPASAAAGGAADGEESESIGGEGRRLRAKGGWGGDVGLGEGRSGGMESTRRWESGRIEKLQSLEQSWESEGSSEQGSKQWVCGFCRQGVLDAGQNWRGYLTFCHSYNGTYIFFSHQ